MEIFYPQRKDINNFNRISLLNPTNCRVIFSLKMRLFSHRKEFCSEKKTFYEIMSLPALKIIVLDMKLTFMDGGGRGRRQGVKGGGI